MKHLIYVKDAIGADIRTRSFFRRDAERLIGGLGVEAVLDFAGVEFISRSVADEICNLLAVHRQLSVVGMSGDVEMMYHVVVNGRSAPRQYPATTGIKVYHLRTMEEMASALCAF